MGDNAIALIKPGVSIAKRPATQKGYKVPKNVREVPIPA